jgi:hypothetical protein
MVTRIRTSNRIIRKRGPIDITPQQQRISYGTSETYADIQSHNFVNKIQIANDYVLRINIREENNFFNEVALKNGEIQVKKK